MILILISSLLACAYLTYAIMKPEKF
ncbi:MULTISPECIES: potassium-transporting ATPase subunit F [Cyclobacteriaceae]|nr:potassium-transporting ATPase subunit F [Mongoliitalea daihaiensis]